MQKMSLTPLIGQLYERLVIDHLAQISLLSAEKTLMYRLISSLGPNEKMIIYKNTSINDEYVIWKKQTQQLTDTNNALSDENRKITTTGRTNKAEHKINKAKIKYNLQQKKCLNGSLMG